MLLNIDKERPDVILDVDRIDQAVREAAAQYPERLADDVDLIARADGTLIIKTTDGGELRWPADRKPDAPKATATAMPAIGARPPVTPAAPGPAGMARGTGNLAARAYGNTAGRPAAPPPVWRPGSTPEISPHDRAVALAEQAALRKFLTLHQREQMADYHAMAQAMRTNDQKAIQELVARHEQVIGQDPAVQKVRQARQNAGG